jgi:hypothetical protein
MLDIEHAHPHRGVASAHVGDAVARPVDPVDVMDHAWPHLERANLASSAHGKVVSAALDGDDCGE